MRIYNIYILYELLYRMEILTGGNNGPSTEAEDFFLEVHI